MSQHFTDGNMEPVSRILIQTVKELQQLPTVQDLNLRLGGGTNLSIRYGHRVSEDIDLFYPSIIGRSKFDRLMTEIKDLYKGKVVWAGYPTDLDDQMMFGRLHLNSKGVNLKIEILHNAQTFDEPEVIDGMKLLSEKDIGMLKLVTAGNRANYKDIYDLDYLTDQILLPDLMKFLEVKLALYNQPHHRTIFDLQYPGNNPITNPQSLLKFENPTKEKDSKPGHSSLRLDIIEGNKNWNTARSSWRNKVRQYFRIIGEPFPSITYIDRNNNDKDSGFNR